jgi:hypothetical protein
MNDEKTAVIHPIGIYKESFFVWLKNLIPAAALYSLNFFFSRILQLSKPMSGSIDASPINLALTVLFVIELLMFAVLNCFFSLIIINYLRDSREKKASFAAAFEEARRSIVSYLKAVILLFVFGAGLMFLAVVFFWVGKYPYGTPAAGQGGRVGVLLATSTASVVLIIGAAWYSFFFSLAPLVAAFENKGPVAAFRESRRRVRGNALRYLAVLVLATVLYVAVGLIALFIVMRFTHARRILNLVDPALAALLGPLWLAIWYQTYRKLTELMTSS